jgi:hypothetical protein
MLGKQKEVFLYLNMAGGTVSLIVSKFWTVNLPEQLYPYMQGYWSLSIVRNSK